MQPRRQARRQRSQPVVAFAGGKRGLAEVEGQALEPGRQARHQRPQPVVADTAACETYAGTWCTK